ncbi:hypothetical protein AB0O76_06530 [Streptomyces sp. NPDC086554]|uniref:hypothetical protein n=1 Tax=Streptomyces sp. NPDC086554 TaxID=3154864 RepID=UPI0034423936
MNGVMITVVLHPELGLHDGPLTAGLTLLPWSAGLAIGSWAAGTHLVPRYGTRIMHPASPSSRSAWQPPSSRTAPRAPPATRQCCPPPSPSPVLALTTSGLDADVAGLRRDYPEVGRHSSTDWAADQDWTLLASAPAHQ